MKILLVGKATPRIVIEKGVPATIYIHTLAEEFISMGHTVDVVCSPLPDTKKQTYGIIEIGNLTLLKHLPKNVYELFYGIKVGLAMRRLHKNYSVVHFLEAPTPAYFSLLFNRKREMPFMFSTGRPIRADLSWHSQGTPFITRMMSNFMHSYVFRHIDKVMTSSKILRTSLIVNLNLRVDKVDPVPFISIQPDLFHPQPKSKTLMQSLGIKEDDKVILCVGEVSPYKNQLTLIKAVASVITDCPKTKLLMVGGIDNKYYKTLINYIKSTSLDSHFLFTGYIKDHSDLPQYYNLADIFALIAEAEGNLPQTVLNAMCCGKPVIVSNLPQSREWAGLNICYVNPYDIKALASTITRLLRSQRLCNELGDSAQKVVIEHHHPKVIAKGILKAYNE